MFTGDRSGEFLYRALYELGFANQSTSVDRGDGLELQGCYITAALRCAPPQNKPRPRELRNCAPYLERELQLLPRVRAVLALGRIAFDAFLRLVYARPVPFRVNSRLGAEGRREWFGPGKVVVQPSIAPTPVGEWPATPRVRGTASGRRDALPRTRDLYPQPLPPRSAFRFAHGASYDLPRGLPRLFASYHPSQQNTQTGRLTPEMLREVLTDIRRFLGKS